ncbi:MAG: tyrosine-type recombinase/integrase [Planctomycetota bacterium]|jgi:site-specific recombinase XerD
MTPLRQRLIQDMQLRGLADSTQRTYVDAIYELAKHFRRPPESLNDKDIREYFHYLTQTRQLAVSTVRTRMFAIRFLFQKTLNREWPVFKLLRSPREKKLPVVLSRDEVWRALNQVRKPVPRMCLTMMYCCGLRASEANHLRAGDIDSQRMVLEVRNGKGAKDRYVPLPQSILDQLRAYWLVERPRHWLFPSDKGNHVIRRDVMGRALKSAAASAEVTKTISCHTLRHSYATHLLEDGVDIRVIQALLGHTSPRTTFTYMHLTQATMKQVHTAVNQLMTRS